MALDIKGGKKTAPAPVKAEAEVKETVAEATAAETVAETTVDGVEYGSARADLAFVCPLGDPSNDDTTTVTDPNGNKTKKVTPTIVGYRFKVLKDMQIPACGTNEKFKNDPMNFDKIDNWIPAKAGQEIDLTPFETALLLSQPQFNGGCDGGEKPVSCVYTSKLLKGQGGDKVSAVTSTPRVSLRAQTGSIKDFDILPVLTFEKVEVNGVPRKKRTIIPGFEKWAPLAAVATKVAGSRGKSAGVNKSKVANQNAQAFLAFVNAKKTQG